MTQFPILIGSGVVKKNLGRKKGKNEGKFNNSIFGGNGNEEKAEILDFALKG